MAKLLQDTYVELAATYDPRWIPVGAKFWDELPTLSRRLLTAVCTEVIRKMVEEEEMEPVVPVKKVGVRHPQSSYRSRYGS